MQSLARPEAASKAKSTSDQVSLCRNRATHLSYETAGLKGSVWISEAEFDVEVLDISLSGANVRSEQPIPHDSPYVVLVLLLEEVDPLVVACEMTDTTETQFELRYLALD